MREMADWEKLVPDDPRYPPQLREGKKKKDWPPTLFCRGNLELLASDRLVAIVGSRRARADMRARLQKFSLIRLQARRSPGPMNGQ
jgi:predicted Rossmann fold nucleotide-binding protein DprA/Smf involved in DNA uptake